MKPIVGPILKYTILPSTQSKAAELLANGEKPGVIVCEDQIEGRGRFDRKWISHPNQSLTASFVFHEYADHPQPWLIGMNLAIIAASTLRLQLQWPNDLILHGKKLGGILTELVPNSQNQKIPVIGLGLNLNQKAFPTEISDRATSLLALIGYESDPHAILQTILDAFESAPEPDSWDSLEPAWRLFDSTPGKNYTLPSGETSTAIGIGPQGQLIAAVDGETRSVMAADAIFGE